MIKLGNQAYTFWEDSTGEAIAAWKKQLRSPSNDRQYIPDLLISKQRYKDTLSLKTWVSRYDLRSGSAFFHVPPHTAPRSVVDSRLTLSSNLLTSLASFAISLRRPGMTRTFLCPRCACSWPSSARLSTGPASRRFVFLPRNFAVCADWTLFRAQIVSDREYTVTKHVYLCYTR